jgi:redox-sensitive bicupin YhaK (pirin superfamily)
MTAGRGISHSEYSTEDTRILHGCQLWLALPEGSREVDPDFEHFAPDAVSGPGWQTRVFLGSLLGSTSPVRTHTPILGAELRLEPGATLEVPVDPTYELGMLVDSGAVSVDGEQVDAHELGYLAPGSDTLRLASPAGATLLLLGGPPFGEEIVMWWNFIGRSHEEVVGFREHWQRLLATGSDDRFAIAPDDPLEALNAPILPNVRLRSRR